MPKQPPQTNSFWPSMRDNALFATVLLVVLILLGTLFATLTLKTLVETDHLVESTVSARTIVVEGVGTGTSAPDIATISVAVETKAETVEQAQDDASSTTTRIVNALTAAGIAQKDIQTTSYDLYEDEVYNPDTNEFEFRGWIVYQMMTVTVRDTELVGEVLDVAGRQGATDIHGPNYAVDDPSVQKQAARMEAINEARSKAVEIANALGVDLGDVVDYEEWSFDGGPYYYDDYAFGYGGVAESVAIEPGEEELTLTVSITFELGD